MNHHYVRFLTSLATLFVFLSLYSNVNGCGFTTTYPNSIVCGSSVKIGFYFLIRVCYKSVQSKECEEEVLSMSNEVYKIPNKPWGWPRSLKFRLVFIWIIAFFILMNLVNLRVIAESVTPFVLGLPFPLFFVFLICLISTIVIIGIYFMWKDLVKKLG